MPSFADRIKSLLHRRSKSQQQPIPSSQDAATAPSTQAPPANSSTTNTTVPTHPQGNQLKKGTAKVYDPVAIKPTASAATVSGTLAIDLVNSSNSSQVYAYITGIALDNNNAVFLLQSDASTPYYASSPSSNGASIPVNVSIPLGAPGNTVRATIPRLAGARVWFSIDKPLQFFLNPGPGLVEPSVFNQSDVNYNTNFSFAEFTFNSSQVFVNISYVDFVSNAPISLTLQDTSGSTQYVSGMPSNGLATVAAGLRAQTASDGQAWSSLIVQSNGQDLRALSPNSGITINSSDFQNYYTNYVDQVWSRYTSSPLIVDTQASYGKVNGQVDSSGNLDFGNGSSFGKPSARDIFSNSSGPFATGSNGQTNAIIPRLAAAFNRSVLLLSNETPDGTNPSQYYTTSPTNHYARIVHSANVDHVGYAFPYDDVTPDGGVPQEGAIFSFSPTLLTIKVGGNGA